MAGVDNSSLTGLSVLGLVGLMAAVVERLTYAAVDSTPEQIVMRDVSGVGPAVGPKLDLSLFKCLPVYDRIDLNANRIPSSVTTEGLRLAIGPNTGVGLPVQ